LQIAINSASKHIQSVGSISYKKETAKNLLFFSIWTQTPYGKKEKRGLNELLPKLLPFGSKHPYGKTFTTFDKWQIFCPFGLLHFGSKHYLIQ
jgi:hypothetical protein